ALMLVLTPDHRLDGSVREMTWPDAHDREDAKEHLLIEQRLWNAYKDSSCNFYNSDFGREGQVIHFPACRASVIERRIKDLENFSSDAQ
ncbi:lysozyme inhibitor LprI family protein, partial [Agrobacterium rosae]|uniref:lysozyme inhibitor LprI family protein n=1 Tax=Agrobacterium rosae TaxID=1972867 RepID=UPI00122EC6CE